MTAYELLTLGVEAYLPELDDGEFAALTRRVRPPKDVRFPAKRTAKRLNAGD
jgi:hypothetical protein